MDRRTFFSLSGAGAVALTAHGSLDAAEHKDRPTAPAPKAASTQPTTSPPLKARLGHQMHEVNDSNLSLLARYGVEGICASATITDPSRIHATAEEMKRLREAVEKHGMTLDITDSVLLPSSLIDEERGPGPTPVVSGRTERHRPPRRERTAARGPCRREGLGVSSSSGGPGGRPRGVRHSPGPSPSVASTAPAHQQ